MSQQRKDIELLDLIAKRLKSIRAEKGVSQEDVFNDTGIHVARVEVGNRMFQFPL